jgi:hypothetical protein
MSSNAGVWITSRQMRVEDWRVKIQTHSPIWRSFVFPLTDPFYIFGQLFSVLASENTGLLASLASVLKKNAYPCHVFAATHYQSQ